MIYQRYLYLLAHYPNRTMLIEDILLHSFSLQVILINNNIFIEKSDC